MSTNSAIKYIGRAKLTLYRGSKIVRTIEHRNHGTAWLFKVLASALCGKDESLNMPRYFDLGTTDDRGIFTSCLASRPALTAKTLSANDIGAENQIAPGGGAQFTAFIPASAVSDTTNINTLRLLSSYTGVDTLLAEILLENNVDLGASNIYNIMLEWIMAFCNDEDAPATEIES